MKKIIAAALALSLAIPSPVYADRTDDQIAKIEKQIEILQAQLDKLKKKKGMEVETGAAQSAVGKIYSITPIQAYYVNDGQRFFDVVQPKAGNTFVVVKLEIENISDKDEYFNWLNFDCYVDGYSTEVNIDVIDREEPVATGDVRAGKKLIGCIALEVPVDWQELEIGYQEDFMGKTVDTTITPDSPIFA